MMSRLGIALSLSALLTWPSHSAAALPDRPEAARYWLEKMSVAMNQMSYQGTFVFLLSGELQTLRITHVVDENGVRERLHSVTGPRREVLRDDHGVRCIMADENAVVEDSLVNRSFFPVFPLDILDQEDRPYRFEVAGAERIAQHSVRRIAIVPLDQYRYGYEFYLEKDTGLLLKWVLLDERRRPLAKLVFTELRLGSEVDPAELDTAALPAEFTRVESSLPRQPMLTLDSPRWRPVPLPPGFRLAGLSRQTANDGGAFEHLVYSDGLAAVSVYIEPDRGGMDLGLRRMGTAHAYIRALGPLRITTLGEVPRVTVQAIGDAVARSHPAP